MTAAVVDTNVGIVANNQSEQAGPECVLRCVDALEEIKRDGIVVIDDGMHILQEYMRHLALAGQPGVGDAFLKWVWDNQANPSRCERVTITPIPDSGGNFEEFPVDPALARFDLADRKFAAVACMSTYGSKVLNATDSDWWIFRQALANNGIVVEFLCPELVTEDSC